MQINQSINQITHYRQVNTLSAQSQQYRRHFGQLKEITANV
jgi:hypothetical protein